MSFKRAVMQLYFNREVQTTGKNYGLYYEKMCSFSVIKLVEHWFTREWGEQRL